MEKLTRLDIYVSKLVENKTLTQQYVSENKENIEDNQKNILEKNEKNGFGVTQMANREKIQKKTHNTILEEIHDDEYEKYIQNCIKATDLRLYQNHYILIEKIHIIFKMIIIIIANTIDVEFV